MQWQYLSCIDPEEIDFITLGLERWELVAIHHVNKVGYRFYFKRPVIHI